MTIFILLFFSKESKYLTTKSEFIEDNILASFLTSHISFYDKPFNGIFFKTYISFVFCF